MSAVALTIELPPELLAQADRAGLLTSQAIAELVAAELRRRQVDRLFAIADKLAALDEPPLSAAELEEEIRAARAEKRSRHARRT
jgi:hypothetical protein